MTGDRNGLFGLQRPCQILAVRTRRIAVIVARTDVWVAICAGVLACMSPAAGAAQQNPFRAWADFVTAPAPYRGPSVPFPDPVERPAASGWRACSELWPVCVHAPEATQPGRLRGALAALEAAYGWLLAEGWPPPYPDGTLGGSADFDVYLAHGANSARALADAPLWYVSELDAAATHATLDASLPDAALARCALDALVQAGLLAHDPAEPESARRASAAFAGLLFSGEAGCDDALQEAQGAPQLGLLGEGEAQETSAALLLALLSRRHDGGSGRFVRGMWEAARQRSRGPNALQTLPSFWQALGRALEQAGESLDAAAIELALARFSAPSADGALPRLPAAASIAPRTLALATLPKQVLSEEPGLATYGSAYARVELPAAGAGGAQLQVWLRGERGIRWSLDAVRLDAAGRELGRLTAPPRKLPESFLPVELTPDTRAVLIAVTALPPEKPRQPLPAGDDGHHFRLIVDQRQP